jgi:hypothetical protein
LELSFEGFDKRNPDRARFPHLLPHLNNAHCLEELKLHDWTLEMGKVNVLKCPHLKNFELKTLDYDACFVDLFAAFLPALEVLQISSSLSTTNATDPPQVAYPRIRRNPFPALQYLSFKGKHNFRDHRVPYFITVLLPGLKELTVERIRQSTLNRIFGARIKRSRDAGNDTEPLWPRLEKIDVSGNLLMQHAEILKVLPAHCPALKFIHVHHTVKFYFDSYPPEIAKYFLDAVDKGVFDNLDKVDLSIDRYRETIWPIQHENDESQQSPPRM